MIEIYRQVGVKFSKTNKFKEMYEAQLELPDGWGRTGYFLEHYKIRISLLARELNYK